MVISKEIRRSSFASRPRETCFADQQKAAGVHGTGQGDHFDHDMRKRPAGVEHLKILIQRRRFAVRQAALRASGASAEISGGGSYPLRRHKDARFDIHVSARTNIPRSRHDPRATGAPRRSANKYAELVAGFIGERAEALHVRGSSKPMHTMRCKVWDQFG